MTLWEAARKYRGVPFKHRGRKPHALDCAGLVWLAAKDCGIELPDFRLYGREPHQDGLVNHVRNALGEPVRGFEPGRVLILRFAIQPHHMAILAPYPYGGCSIIHACGENGRVIETRFSPDMEKRVTHIFRSPV